MKSINCPNCQNQISAKDDICPNCGCQIVQIAEKLDSKSGSKDKNKSSKKILFIILIFIIVIALGVGGYFIATANSRNYEKAVTLFNENNYSEALELFNNASEYKNSKEYIKKCNYELSEEGKFLRALATGLEKRWTLTDKYESVETDTTAEQWHEFINAEYDSLKDFKELKFKDEKLGKMAKEYIELLEEADKTVKYYENQSDIFWNQYNPIYQKRCVLIKQIAAEYTIPVNGKHNQYSLDNLITEGETVISARKIIDNIKFKKVKNDYGWKTYSAVAKNTSNVDFSYFKFNIKLVYDNGTVAETISADTENWKINEEHKFSFETSEKFDKIVVDSCEYI